jgi:CHASE2 domain-containing sensor protein
MIRNGNIVLSVELKDHNEGGDVWLRLVGSHPKFKSTFVGFSNISITDDSVLIPELPMRQRNMGITSDRVLAPNLPTPLNAGDNNNPIFLQRGYLNIIPSLSYETAIRSFGVKEEYRGKGMQDYVFKRKDFAYRFRIIMPHDLFASKFKSSDIKNKIVILGFYSTEDFFYANPKRTKVITGTQIQAGFINAIVEHH